MMDLEFYSSLALLEDMRLEKTEKGNKMKLRVSFKYYFSRFNFLENEPALPCSERICKDYEHIPNW